MAGYWERLTSNRYSRRRALSGAAAVGMGAAAAGIVGCGGGDSGGADSGGQDSGLLSKPVDTTSKMKPGGTFRGSSYPPTRLPLIRTPRRGSPR